MPVRNYPRGQIAPDDEGEFELAVGVENGTVKIVFGKPVTWIGFGPVEAKAFGERLIQLAKEIEQ